MVSRKKPNIDFLKQSIYLRSLGRNERSYAPEVYSKKLNVSNVNSRIQMLALRASRMSRPEPVAWAAPGSGPLSEAE
jgi:hypothetical protein